MASGAMDFLLPRAPSILAAVLLAGLAAWVLKLGPRNRANRTFGLLLLLGGVSFASLTLQGYPDADVARWAARVTAHQVPLFIAALVAFASVYPRERGWIARSRWGFGALAAAVLAVELALLIDPTLYGDPVRGADGAVVTLTFGPLFAVVGLSILVRGAVVVVLMRDYAAYATGTKRTCVLLVATGLALPIMHAGTVFLVDPERFFSHTPGVWGWTSWALFMAGLATMTAATALLLRRAKRSNDVQARTHARRAAMALAVPVLTGIVVGTLAADTSTVVPAVISGFWRLMFPLVVTYALVKHQLFDIDVKLKWTLKQSTVAAIFLAVFFAVSEGSQAVFSDRLGTFVGIGAASLLVFAIHPLQRAAERVANVAMPRVHAASELSRDERSALYGEQVRFAWADGNLSHDERLILENLRERLGLSVEDAARLEREVHRSAARPG